MYAPPFEFEEGLRVTSSPPRNWELAATGSFFCGAVRESRSMCPPCLRLRIQRGPGYQLRAPHPAGAGALKAEVSQRELMAKSFNKAYRALARSKPSITRTEPWPGIEDCGARETKGTRLHGCQESSLTAPGGHEAAIRCNGGRESSLTAPARYQKHIAATSHHSLTLRTRPPQMQPCCTILS